MVNVSQETKPSASAVAIVRESYCDRNYERFGSHNDKALKWKLHVSLLEIHLFVILEGL